MDQVDVHNDRAEKKQTEWNKASDKQKRAANHLQRTDNVKVMTQKECLTEVSNQRRRRRWHWDELEKDVQSEHNKNESEKNAGDNGGDFHTAMLTRSRDNSNPISCRSCEEFKRAPVSLPGRACSPACSLSFPKKFPTRSARPALPQKLRGTSRLVDSESEVPAR